MNQTVAMQLVGLLLIGAAALLALGLVYLVFDRRRRHHRKRPSWDRIMADTAYFQRVLNAIFQAKGFTVRRCLSMPDPIERQHREVVFELQRDGYTVAALCGRWVIPYTSEMITRFEHALRLVPAAGGIIITTSFFTEAATHKARQLAGVTLYDGAAVQGWIDECWPA